MKSTGLAYGRRDFLALLAASTASVSIPLKAYALPILPVLQAAAAIITIVTGLNTRSSQPQPDYKSILKEINLKLDLIIRNQAEIIEQLRLLRSHVTDEFKRDAIEKLNSLKDTFDFQVIPIAESRRITDADRAFLRNFLSQILVSTFDLRRYDFGAGVAFGSGIGMSLFVASILKSEERDVRALRLKFSWQYDAWLDIKNPLSILWTISEISEEIRLSIIDLDGRNRVINLGNDRVDDPDRHENCRVITSFAVVGDYKDGFSGRTVAKKDDCHSTTRPPPPESDGCHNPKFECFAEERRIVGELLAKRPGLADGQVQSLGLAGTMAPVEIFDASSFLNEFNIERERIQALEKTNLELKDLATVYGRIRDELRRTP